MQTISTYVARLPHDSQPQSMKIIKSTISMVKNNFTGKTITTHLIVEFFKEKNLI